jgi:excisionase family DNA binding protein
MHELFQRIWFSICVFVFNPISRRHSMSERSDPQAGRTEFITVKEAAAHLRVSQRTVYRWLKLGYLKAFQTGRGTTRILSREFERFIAENTGLLKEQEE